MNFVAFLAIGAATAGACSRIDYAEFLKLDSAQTNT
jgi:hypothetical protein